MGFLGKRLQPRLYTELSKSLSIGTCTKIAKQEDDAKSTLINEVAPMERLRRTAGP